MKRLFAFLLLLITMFSPLSIEASQYIKTDASPIAYSVRPVLPDNQFSEASFFEIEMLLGQVQDLEVIISNTSDQAIQVGIEAHTAATNSNGVITYDGRIDEFYEAMPFTFSELAQVETSPITIPANSEVSAFVTVQAPDDSFDGQILGGLHFRLIEDAPEDAAEGVSIQHKYAYVIGVNIIEQGKQNEIVPDLVLDSISVGEIDYREGVEAKLINKTPVLVRNLTVEGAIYPSADDQAIIYKREVENFSIAPYNIVYYPVVFEEGNLIPGDYVFRGKAFNEDYEWQFEESFTIE